MNYVRYLSSKRTVDDRALNPEVIRKFEEILRERKATSQFDPTPLRVLEIGAGIGAMLIRLWKSGVFKNFQNVDYTLLDLKSEVLEEARSLIHRELEPTVTMTAVDSRPTMSDCPAECRLPSSIAVHHTSTKSTCLNDSSRLTLSFQGSERTASAGQQLQVRFQLGDAFDILSSLGEDDKVDVVIAAAFLDLTNLGSAVPLILSGLSSRRGIGAFYFPINFDGVTALQPASTARIEFDRLVEKEFHECMGLDNDGERRSETGRRLLGVLKMQRPCSMYAGPSAWIVTADANGGYTADEAYFLQCLIDFIESAVTTGSIAANRRHTNALASYFESRRKQIQNGDLMYVAHNIDYCGYIK